MTVDKRGAWGGDIASADPEAPFPSQTRAWFVLAILWVVTLFSQLDRQLPSLLVKPLKSSFGLADTQFSLLQGYGFALAYTIMGLPFGRLVDRANRRNLILMGVLVWSAMTICAAFAQSYPMLLLTRAGVGIGEAVLAPAAYSIIADYVPRARRGRALAAYYVSLAIGSGASLLIGGLLLAHVPAPVAAGPLGILEPWQVMFVLAGLPGLPLALLILLVREPVRRERGSVETASYSEFLRYLGQHRATFARLLTYPALLAAIGYGVLAWAPAYMDRRFHFPASRAGIIVGIVVGLSGLLGTLLSGWLSDRWVGQGKPAARFRVTIVGWALIIPGACLWPLMPTPFSALAVLGCAIFGFAVSQSSAPPTIQDAVPNSMRGKAIAVYLLLGGLLGIGLGPTSVALLTDRVFHDEAMLGSSLILVSVPASLVGLWLCWSGLRPYAETTALLRRDLD
ncbi:MAG: MFS transporter [Sphingobium sp.]|nr:MFS transporter [Sphingobium sp.]